MGKTLPKKIIEEVGSYKKILIRNKLPISGMFVFGSYAKGNFRKDSDIDVCVVSPKFKDPWNALSYLNLKVPYGLGWKIEAVGFSPKDFNDTTSPLIHEIKKYGIKV